MTITSLGVVVHGGVDLRSGCAANARHAGVDILLAPRGVRWLTTPGLAGASRRFAEAIHFGPLHPPHQ